MDVQVAVQGGKLVYGTPGLYFINSLDTLLMKLSSLPQSFEFEGYKDYYFPHLFLQNTTENQNYVGPQPQLQVDNTMLKEKKHFLPWHAANPEIFDLQKERC